MSRLTLTKRRGIPRSQVRWLISDQLRADLKVVSLVTRQAEGDIAEACIRHCLQYLVPRWNERHEVQIPPLAVLEGKPLRAFTIKEWLAEIERANR